MVFDFRDGHNIIAKLIRHSVEERRPGDPGGRGPDDENPVQYQQMVQVQHQAGAAGLVEVRVDVDALHGAEIVHELYPLGGISSTTSCRNREQLI